MFWLWCSEIPNIETLSNLLEASFIAFPGFFHFNPWNLTFYMQHQVSVKTRQVLVPGKNRMVTVTCCWNFIPFQGILDVRYDSPQLGEPQVGFGKSLEPWKWLTNSYHAWWNTIILHPLSHATPCVRQVVSDIDDTLLCSGAAFPAGAGNGMAFLRHPVVPRYWPTRICLNDYYIIVDWCESAIVYMSLPNTII